MKYQPTYNYDKRWTVYFLTYCKDLKNLAAAKDKLIRDYKANKNRNVVRN